MTQPKESYYIREILDKHQYKGEPIQSLSRKKLAKAMNLMLLYVPYLEATLKKNEIKSIDPEEST